MTTTAFAPGKLILMGEHAVVYGHYALAMAVNRGLRVTLTERSGPTGLDHELTADPRLQEALLTVLPREGIGVHIESTLPMGRGMGSSAALAVALARASLQLAGETCTDEVINDRAFAVERVFHGSPSGIDHTVSMRGGTVLYRRTKNGPEFSPFDMPTLPIVVIDSGSAGNTATMVERVASDRRKNDPYLTQMGELLEQTKPVLQSGDLQSIGQAWYENHWLLRAIGVSTPTLDRIVRTAIDAGATGAKLAGAGGGGVVIAVCPDPIPVLKSAETHGWNAFEVKSPGPSDNSC